MHEAYFLFYFIHTIKYYVIILRKKNDYKNDINWFESESVYIAVQSALLYSFM